MLLCVLFASSVSNRYFTKRDGASPAEMIRELDYSASEEKLREVWKRERL